MLKYPNDGGLKKPVRKLEKTLSIFAVIAKHYGLKLSKK